MTDMGLKLYGARQVLKTWKVSIERTDFQSHNPTPDSHESRIFAKGGEVWFQPTISIVGEQDGLMRQRFQPFSKACKTVKTV